MRIIISLAIVYVLAGCKQEKSVPPDVLSREKMEQVMWDMMQADQFVAGFLMHSDSGLNRIAESTKLYQQVFAIHDISKQDFSKSLDYYRSQPLLLKDIMDSLARTKTIAPSKPVVTPVDTVPAGEERIVEPLKDTFIRPGKRRLSPVPVN